MATSPEIMSECDENVVTELSEIKVVELTGNYSAKRRKIIPTKRATVWQHFTSSAIDDTSCTCRHCGLTIKRTTGNTTGMHNHMQRHHPNEFRVAQDAPKQQRLDVCRVLPKSVVPKQTVETLMIKAVCQDGIPMSIFREGKILQF